MIDIIILWIIYVILICISFNVWLGAWRWMRVAEPPSRRCLTIHSSTRPYPVTLTHQPLHLVRIIKCKVSKKIHDFDLFVCLFVLGFLNKNIYVYFLPEEVLVLQFAITQWTHNWPATVMTPPPPPKKKKKTSSMHFFTHSLIYYLFTNDLILIINWLLLYLFISFTY